nr:hypothetical protein [Tanacetum cinerariifolium]
MENYLEHPIPAAPVALPGQQVPPHAIAAQAAWVKGQKEFVAEGQSVSSHFLKMKGYIDNLERLGQPVEKNLAMSLILVSLNKDFDSFVQNYNMHGMGKTVNELHAMLKLHEESLPKKDANPALHAIRAGRVQKNQKNKPHKAAKGGHGKGKGKMGNASFANKPKTPPSPKKDNPAKDAVCHQCGEVGHWSRNYPVKSWIFDAGCGTHICITTKGLRGSKKLKPSALSLYVGDGHRTAVEAIETYHLELLSGLVIVLNNFHYAPSITRGVISVSRLFDDGFVNPFDENNVISVSKNNLVYFMAVPRDGIYEIDMTCTNTSDSSMYAITYKRAKINLDSSLLWHCCLGHISKKRIEKVQHDGLLNSIDIESLEKCVSCMSGKMARKPYSHQMKKAKDLLGLIHTDVCGPFKIVSRQGASYFVTFTDDFSRYGYVYLLKHKHEVFETFKVFQKEVENQLGKTIKSQCSDRGVEYMSQEFLDHLKEHMIIAHHTPPYTPQNNRVLERYNQTLLDMVRSMMSQTTIPKSFWGYALETVARFLNMVPTKKVDKTPYEIWHGQAPKLSYLKVWGYLKASESVEDLELIQKEDTNPSVDTSLEHEEDDQEIDEPQSDINPIRKSSRTRRAPDRMCLYIDAEEYELGDLGEPANYKATLLDPESKKWLDAMNVEMQSMKDNDVWVLVELPPNARIVGSKWLFKKKTDMDGALYIFKARLVANGFTQTYGVDYEETFSPVADIRAIRILIDIAAYYDYEIWQIDVKTAFLNGHLSEEVYMEKPKAYIEKILKRVYMENSKRGTIPMQEKLKLSKSQGASTPAEKQRMQNIPYASAVGSIMYAVRCTRPDVAFAQNMTSRFQRNPGNMEREHRVSCYTDAGYLTDADNLKSQIEYVFVLNRGVVDWKSTKQSIFATSSTDAEYIAAFDASKEAVWICKFISSLGIVPRIEEPISMYCDNTGAIAIAKDDGVTKGARHFCAKVHYLRETIKLGDVKIEKIDTDDNLTDPFTKALGFPKHS